MDRIPFMRRWDEAVLLRFPLLWQLRLHIYLPLALLCLLLAWWVGAAWLADPAHVLLGVGPMGDDAHLYMLMVVLGAMMLWLLRCRRYNCWRAHYPMGRWAWGWEFLAVWALGFGLALCMYSPGLGYRMGIAVHQRYEVDAARGQKVIERLWLLDFFTAPENNAFAKRQATILEERQGDGAHVKGGAAQVLGAFMRQDEVAIVQMLQDYDRMVSRHGFASNFAYDFNGLAQELLRAYLNPQGENSGRWKRMAFLVRLWEQSATSQEGAAQRYNLDGLGRTIAGTMFGHHGDVHRSWRIDGRLQWHRKGRVISTVSHYAFLRDIRHAGEDTQWWRRGFAMGAVDATAAFALAFAALAVLWRALSKREMAVSAGLFVLVLFLSSFISMDMRRMDVVYAAVVILFAVIFVVSLAFCRSAVRDESGIWLAQTVAHVACWLGVFGFLQQWQEVLSGAGDEGRDLPWSLIGGFVMVTLCFAISPLVRRWQGLPRRT